jgi:hypothetical protein
MLTVTAATTTVIPIPSQEHTSTSDNINRRSHPNDYYNDSIDRYLVSLANGTYSVPCGRQWLPYYEQPCADITIALLLATADVYEEYRSGRNNTNFLFTVEYGIYPAGQISSIGISCSKRSNITIIGIGQTCSHTNTIIKTTTNNSDEIPPTCIDGEPPTLNITTSRSRPDIECDFEFIGPINLTITNLVICVTSIGYNNADGSLSMIPWPSGDPLLDPSPPSLILIGVKFKGYRLRSDPHPPILARGLILSCEGLSSLVISSCQFDDARAVLDEPRSANIAIVWITTMSSNSTISITDTSFTNHILTRTGSVIELDGASHISLINVTVAHNYISHYIDDPSRGAPGLNIRGAVAITDISKDSNGNNSVIIKGCTIINNTIDTQFQHRTADPRFVQIASGAGTLSALFFPQTHTHTHTHPFFFPSLHSFHKSASVAR